MKAIMCKWTGEATSTLPSWWHDDEEADLTMEMIGELYACGVNVMLKHAGGEGVGGEKMIVFIDTKAFTQR